MNIAIVGNGAIGNILAARCEKIGQKYCLLTRTGQVLPISVTNIEGETTELNGEIRSINAPDDFDILFLPLKAYQILPALMQLRPFIRSNQKLILLHNGMGCIEQATELLANIPILAATTSYAAYKPTPNLAIETGLGESHIGWVNQPIADENEQIKQLMDALLPPCTWHADIRQALWFKLAVNAVINPLTAIYQIPNGQLRLPQYQAMIQEICQESAQVMQAHGLDIDLQEILARVYEVIDKTAKNYSSMHQDIALKRVTEIDYINGYIATTGNKYGIKTPQNNKLVATIKQLHQL